MSAFAGPVDPALIGPSIRLPPPRSMEQWRERVLARFMGRLSRGDFDLAFDAVCKWLEGRPIGIEQAQQSAADIVISMTHVHPSCLIQRCEKTGVTLLTIAIRNDQGRAAHVRTRCVTLRDPPPNSGANGD